MNTKTILNKMTAVMLSLCIASLASCEKEQSIENPPAPTLPEPGELDINFQAAISQWAGAESASDLNKNWAEGDEIGVFATVAGQALGTENYINNLKVVYKEGKWVSSSDAKWPSDNTSLDFYAYYPYSNEVADPTNFKFSISESQDSINNFTASDLMNASLKNVSVGNTVLLPFTHLFSIVELKVESASKGMGICPEAVLSMSGIAKSVTANLSAESGKVVSVDNDSKATVVMHRKEKQGDENWLSSYTYCALIPSQEIESGNSLFNFDLTAIGGEIVLSAKLQENLVLVSGNVSSYSETPEEIRNILHTVYIPAGKFMMGSPEDEEDRGTYWLSETLHEVTFTKGFRMTPYEITNSMYVCFLNESGLAGEEGFYDSPEFGRVRLVNPRGIQFLNGEWITSDSNKDLPVVGVTWFGANEFAKWYGGSLPTESQWEYACRAGSQDAYPFNKDEINDYAWTSANASSVMPVGMKEPNGFGLYDMIGNAYEWCDDWFVEEWGSEPLVDPKGESSGTKRSVRSGSIRGNIGTHRSASRNNSEPFFESKFFGFRIVFNE